MKAHLMFRDRDFDLQQEQPWNEQALIQDLELTTLFDAMALGDKFLFEVAKKAILSSSADVNTILYRQDVLTDCLNRPSIVRGMYALAVEAIENERKNFWGIFSGYPAAILRRSVQVLEMFVEILRKLRQIADEHVGEFKSAGFTTLFAMLSKELSDEYFESIQAHLKYLKFSRGVLISAELGDGNKGVNYVLRRAPTQHWMKQIFTDRSPAYTFRIADRDDNGAKALSELQDRGINLVANALAQSNDHILSFFNMLRTELAFYVGCLNLHEQLTQLGIPTCLPVPLIPEKRGHAVEDLCDVCLALTMKTRVVGNDLNANGKDLVIITGANQGGKSTFLRSIGVSQLMMQCGMFVPAKAFSASVCTGLYTHYKREEDATMKSGKLDEELSRMSDIVDNISPGALMLFNESFAATNEREGSEIARQIVDALLEEGIKVFFVTHLYEFAHGCQRRKRDRAVFLRAERQADGTRTFKLVEGEPLGTSYGEDLYKVIFEATD